MEENPQKPPPEFEKLTPQEQQASKFLDYYDFDSNNIQKMALDLHYFHENNYKKGEHIPLFKNILSNETTVAKIKECIKHEQHKFEEKTEDYVEMFISEQKVLQQLETDFYNEKLAIKHWFYVLHPRFTLERVGKFHEKLLGKTCKALIEGFAPNLQVDSQNFARTILEVYDFDLSKLFEMTAYLYNKLFEAFDGKIIPQTCRQIILNNYENRDAIREVLEQKRAQNVPQISNEQIDACCHRMRRKYLFDKNFKINEKVLAGELQNKFSDKFTYGDLKQRAKLYLEDVVSSREKEKLQAEADALYFPIRVRRARLSPDIKIKEISDEEAAALQSKSKTLHPTRIISPELRRVSTPSTSKSPDTGVRAQAKRTSPSTSKFPHEAAEHQPKRTRGSPPPYKFPIRSGNIQQEGTRYGPSTSKSADKAADPKAEQTKDSPSTSESTDKADHPIKKINKAKYMLPQKKVAEAHPRQPIPRILISPPRSGESVYLQHRNPLRVLRSPSKSTSPEKVTPQPKRTLGARGSPSKSKSPESRAAVPQPERTRGSPSASQSAKPADDPQPERTRGSPSTSKSPESRATFPQPERTRCSPSASQSAKPADDDLQPERTKGSPWTSKSPESRAVDPQAKRTRGSPTASQSAEPADDPQLKRHKSSPSKSKSPESRAAADPQSERTRGSPSTSKSADNEAVDPQTESVKMALADHDYDQPQPK